LQSEVEYLRTKLDQSQEQVQEVQQHAKEDKQRSDTIIMQLTKQLKQTLMLEDMRHRSIWKRLKAVFATEAV